MKDLIGKYRMGRLTGDELEDSRRRSSVMSDEELSDAIHEDWIDYEVDASTVDYEVEERVYSHINSEFLNGQRVRSRVWNVVRWAAVIAFPVMLAVMAFMYQRIADGDDSMMSVVSTGWEERASVTMPDGSVIELNGNSMLEYDLADFKRDDRSVRFSGEGYFDIAKLEGSSFTVHADGLDVMVTGTSFNLQTAVERDFSTLFLIEGSVSLRADGRDDLVDMMAGEKAVVDNRSGSIELLPIGSNDNPVGWKTKKLFFKNAALSSVAGQLESIFNCRLDIDDRLLDETFTGLVPLNSLEGAVEVVEKAFNTEIAVEQLFK